MQSSESSLASVKLDTLPLIAWVGICFFALTWHLGEVPPYHTDESYYVESVQTMVESGDYLTPYYHGDKRFAKPIFVYWLMAAAYKAFGFSPAVARLCSAVMGTLCVALVYLLARRLFGRTAAWLSVLIFPGFYLHFQLSRWATTDMTLNFFILAAYYFFVRGFQEEERRAESFHLLYLCMAFGFLTKGPIAVLLPGVAIFLFLLIARQWKLFAQLRLFTGVLIILAINLPWFIVMYSLHGNEFTSHLITAEVRGRVFNETPFSFYFFGVLVRYYLPWSLFLVSGLLVYVASFFSRGNRGIQTRKPFHKDSWLFCCLGVLVPLAIFSLLRIQHSRYMLPALPFLAVMLGGFFAVLAQSGYGFRSPGFKIPFLLTLLFYGVMAIGVGSAMVIYFSISRAPFGVYFLPIFLAFGVTALALLYLYKKKSLIIMVMAFIQLVTVTLVSGDAIPFFNRYPMKKFAAEILQNGNRGEPVAAYKLGNNGAKLGVLTGHPVFDIQGTEELRLFVSAHETVYVIMREASWRQAFEGDSFVFKARDTVWKARTAVTGNLEAVWNRGIKTALADYSESLVLLQAGREKSAIMGRLENPPH